MEINDLKSIKPAHTLTPSLPNPAHNNHDAVYCSGAS